MNNKENKNEISEHAVERLDEKVELYSALSGMALDILDHRIKNQEKEIKGLRRGLLLVTAIAGVGFACFNDTHKKVSKIDAKIEKLEDEIALLEAEIEEMNDVEVKINE